MNTPPNNLAIDNHQIAAIDMGSNSFHMVIAQICQGELKILARLSEKVQLASGLDPSNKLDQAAQERGLDCLARFAQRLQGITPENIRVVGTNALRIAKNANTFVSLSEELLGIPVDIIAGREEARLIYLGVAHSVKKETGNRLVMDIGGGSTEFILGKGFEPILMESLHMGCVSYRERFFPNGRITKRNFQQAITAARREILPISTEFKKKSWRTAVGASGSIRIVEQIMSDAGLGDEGITLPDLKWLRNEILKFDHTDNLALPGLKPERFSIFPSGVAILFAAFQQLGIEKLYYSEGALREGLLYDQLGRCNQEDVRDRTTEALISRYRVDVTQTERVTQTALKIWQKVKKDWNIEKAHYRDLIERAAKLHEIGLSISHTQFHKHGAYLIKHSDLAGFSRQEQSALAAMIRTHRRKFPISVFEELPDSWYEPILYLSLVLRLAVLLCHSRTDQNFVIQAIKASSKKIELKFDSGWLSKRPLTAADLNSEAEYLEKSGIQLKISES